VTETEVRVLRKRDVSWAIRLTDLERWGYTRADFERLLALEPEGCFVALVGGKRAGITCSITYGKLAFIGAVIVHPDVRGKHVGEALMKSTLDYVDGKGVETARLNAYLNVVPFYERLGFRGEYENVRYHGNVRASGTPDAERPATPEDLPAIAHFDSFYFGAPRERLLARLLQEFPQHFLVARDEGGIRGYIVANADAGAVEIGPWVANPTLPDVAGDLLHGLLSRLGPTRIGLTAPTPNEHHERMAGELRLETAFRTLRMYRGRDAYHGLPKGIFALAGLEKG
jgi:ribosomal protein S18 acetylase RimI-like enzyme